MHTKRFGGFFNLFILAAPIFLIPFSSLSFAQETQPKRPLVFIPGILGSKLVDSSGKLLWGGVGSYLHLDKLELPHDPTKIKLQPSGIIESIKVLGPIRVKQYTGLVEWLEEIGYEQNPTAADMHRRLLLFPYDWRRSNFTTADILADTIKNEFQGREIDILAHSMGGTVARILLEQYQNDPNVKVKNLLTLGTPHQGSMLIIDAVHNGLGGLQNFLAGGMTTVRRVLLSFESGYELAPTYSRCCILGRKEQGAKRPVKILDQLDWWESWYGTSLSSVDKEHLASSLSRAKELKDLLDRYDPTGDNPTVLPTGQRFYRFAGSNIDTIFRIYVDPDTNEPDAWQEREGDGKVWIRSAAADAPEESQVSFTQHGRIFDDDSVRESLKRILSEDMGFLDFSDTTARGKIKTRTGKYISIQSVSIELDSTFIRPGQDTNLIISFKSKSGQPQVSDVIVSVSLCRDETNTCGPETVMTETTSADGVSEYVASFSPTEPGTYRTAVSVPALGRLEEYIVVVADPF